LQNIIFSDSQYNSMARNSTKNRSFQQDLAEISKICGEP